MDVFSSLNSFTETDLLEEEYEFMLPSIHANPIPAEFLPAREKKENEEENTYKWKFLDVDIKNYGNESIGAIYEDSAANVEEGFNLIQELRDPKLKKPHNVPETKTTGNFLQQINNFYEEMSLKIKYLKSIPLMKHNDDDIESMETLRTETLYPKEFLQADKTSEIMKSISDIDDEINKTETELQAARSERLEVQNEMCNEIYKYHKFPDKNSQLFLELCSFEAASNSQHPYKHKEPKKKKNKSSQDKPKIDETTQSGKDFLKRNIQLAKQGIMANCSLTDEEKQKLEDLVCDIDMNIDSSDRQSSEADHLDTFILEPTFSGISSMESKTQAQKTRPPKSYNAFLINEDKLTDIDALDKKIDDIKKVNDLEEKVNDRNYNCGFKGRPWQDSLLQKKLKEVNLKLKAVSENNTKDDPINLTKINLEENCSSIDDLDMLESVTDYLTDSNIFEDCSNQDLPNNIQQLDGTTNIEKESAINSKKALKSSMLLIKNKGEHVSFKE